MESEYNLVVAEPFDDYERGSMITDAETITKILESDNAGHVRKVKKGE